MEHLLLFEKELFLSLPGFMICMLPALEDQNGEKLKRVEEILRKTENIVGTSEFYGEIWKAMLRTPRTRQSAIKYLDKRIPRDLEAAKELARKRQIFMSHYRIKVCASGKPGASQETRVVVEEIARSEEDFKRLEEKFTLDDYFSLYYPMKDRLCINSLLAGLADSSVYVNRGVLDFLISHIPFTGRVNTEIENVKLVEGALYTLHRKDFAFIKKFFIWVLGHIDDDGEETDLDPSDPVIRILVPALKLVFKKYLDKSELQKMMPKDQNKLGGVIGAQ